MRTAKPPLHALLVCLIFIIISCGGVTSDGNSNRNNSSSTSQASLTSIEVTPLVPYVAKGTSQQFTAKGIYSDNTTRDITALVAWSSSPPDTAAINRAGLATGVATGTATIAATIGRISGSATLTIVTEVYPWVDVRAYGAKGDGVTDDTEAIQAALNSGAYQIFLPAGTYKITSSLVPPSSSSLIGQGKGNTILLCGANVVALDITDINDFEASDFLISANAAQSAPAIRLTASSATIARNNFHGIQIAGNAQTFTAIQLRTTGAFGIWNNNFYDISASGVGTVVELNTGAAGSWIRQNRFENFYVNDYVIGVNFINPAGDGGSENVFRDWGAQTSSRTTIGMMAIPASSAGVNQYNMFDAFSVYDLITNNPAGKYYTIGAGVVGTQILNPTGDIPTPGMFTDNGIETRQSGFTGYLTQLLQSGHFLQIPTNAGWTPAVTGSGSTLLQVAANQTRTGTTLNSTARLYTDAIDGFSSASAFSINFDKTIVFSFNISRFTAEPNAIGRVQLKPVQTEGALTGKGIGLKVSNYALYGESYGTAEALVDLGVTLTDGQNAQVTIILYRGNRIEWWVDGVYKARQTNLANVPSGLQVCYLVHSLITTISNPSGDAQMFLMQPWLWSDL